MTRVLTIFAIVFFAIALLTSSCFAQDNWPQYQAVGGSADIDRGAGWYFAWYKFLLVIPLWLVWVKTADWINRDLQTVGEQTDMSLDVWNPVVVFVFFAGFLAVLTVPYFFIGYLLFLAAAIAPFLAYVFQRNAEVHPEDKVFTWTHIKNRMKGKKGKQSAAFKELPQDEGPPVEFAPAGETNEQKQTNLIAARQNPAFLEVKTLFSDAVMRRAEIVRMDFTKTAVAVRYQIDGVWHNIAQRDRQTGDAMLAAIKQVANLNPAERRVKQEGDFGFEIPDRKMNCAVRSQGVKTGEAVQLAISQKKKKAWTLAELGMLPDTEATLKEYLNAPGYVLVSALPGDGLSTTWEGVLTTADRVMRDVVGIVDVKNRENIVENIELTKFDASKGESPDQFLKAILLKQPEAIVLPDPVNATTIDLLTHEILKESRSVVSQVKAQSAEEAILRILALKPDRSSFAKSLTCVLFQRLVRRLCDYCKTQYHPPPQLLKKLRIDPKTSPILYKQWQPPPPEELVDEKGRPMEPVLCTVCGGLGYIGRIAIYELLKIDDNIRKMIVNDPRVESIRQAALQSGHVPMSEQGLKLVLAGVTSLSELQRVLKKTS